MNLLDIQKKFDLDDKMLNRLYVLVKKVNKAVTKTSELSDSEYATTIEILNKLLERFPKKEEKKEEEPSEAPSAVEETPEAPPIKQPRLKKEKAEKLLREKQKAVEEKEKKGGKPKEKGAPRKKEAAPAPEPPPKAADKKGKPKKLSKEQLKELERQKREEKLERERRAQFMRSLMLKKKKKKKKKKEKEEAPEETQTNVRRVPSGQTVGALADILGVSPAEVISKLMEMGEIATINQQLDDEVAYTIAAEFGYELEFVNPEELLSETEQEAESEEELEPRPPIVTVMGHVDHGKTTLLDAIRETKVAEAEVGGITQKIGAYQVEVNGKLITFIDTPGHEAFTSMRARGAKVTDIVVLVVAADDGVKPQTVEAINHAKAAKVPIIVAINKIDKEGVNIDAVKKQLSDYDLIPEEWGGDVPFVNISAKKRIGLDELLEYILLQAELLELKANPNRHAEAFVLESKVDKGRGPVATVIVTNGTLHKGEYFVCGNVHGKVRLLVDHLGRTVDSAGPATPVEIIGFEALPLAGDKLEVVENEKVAKEIIEKRQGLLKTAKASGVQKPTLDLEQFLSEGTAEVKEINLIIKGDVMGSVEAIIDSLMKLNTDEIKTNVIHYGVGAVNESDVMLAKASNARIIAFSTSINPKARELIEREKVDVRQYKIIYELLEDVQKMMKGLEEVKFAEKIIGYAEVRAVFNISKVGKVAGCYVRDGVIRRNALVRVIRNDKIVHEGTIKSLRRFKEDVREVGKGFECGVSIENFSDVHEGDVLEVFERVEEE